MASRVMDTVAEEAGQTPFITVHKNVLVPVTIPETAVVGEFGFAIRAGPVDVQVPLPTLTRDAVRVAVDEHITWLTPAFAAVPVLSRNTETTAVALGHTPLLTVHK